MNYCHHHAPAYEAVAPYRIWCDGTSYATCVCNKAGENRTLPWNGECCRGSGGGVVLVVVVINCLGQTRHFMYSAALV